MWKNPKKPKGIGDVHSYRRLRMLSRWKNPKKPKGIGDNPKANSCPMAKNKWKNPKKPKGIGDIHQGFRST